MKIIPIILLIISFSTIASAVSGVRPALYEVDFKPGFSENFIFNYLFDKDSEINLHVGGDLSEYVTLNKDSFKGPGSVTATINLPEKIDIPGVHRIRIGAKQMPSGKTGISLVADVGGIIKIRVPYPKKYAEIELQTENVNQGETSNIEIETWNRGEENITVAITLEIFDKNNLVEKIITKPKFIESTKSETFNHQLSTQEYKAGNYIVNATAEYGGENPTTAKETIRIGELFINITNTTKILKRNSVNQFDIEIESLWNNPIENVYVEGTIKTKNISFKTPSIKIDPWEKTTLAGFFDTSNIKNDSFNVDLSVIYEELTTNKTTRVQLEKEKTNTTNTIIIGLALIILILIGIIFWKKYGKKK